MTHISSRHTERRSAGSNRRSNHGTTEEELFQILAGNATEVYGFRPGVLQPIADGVGFEVGELLSPPDKLIRDFRDA
jgi:hypothetical protein